MRLSSINIAALASASLLASPSIHSNGRIARRTTQVPPVLPQGPETRQQRRQREREEAKDPRRWAGNKAMGR